MNMSKKYGFPLFFSVLLVSCTEKDVQNPGEPDFTGTPYVTKVLDYCPAPGQFVNTMPEYEEGDTQASMNQKALRALSPGKGGITLGGYGGYVVVGFDHTIENRAGLCDFRVLGNAFHTETGLTPGVSEEGTSEAGIIRVAYDRNKNGIPDPDEWYEIAGSAHKNSQGESWIEKAKLQGNDVNLYRDYEMKYVRIPDYVTGGEKISWSDNKGNSGFRTMLPFHRQSYYPLWKTQDTLLFKGTRLPQNAVSLAGAEEYFVLYPFAFGYADNVPNTSRASSVDIAWAVDSAGNPVNLPGADFIMIYTGINQENGNLGESSTEILGVEDLHILGQVIQTF